MQSSLEILQSEFDQLQRQFPSAQLPPNCSVLMKGKYIDYDSRVMLKILFPVLEEYLNPMKAMQGGFVTAAFDNVFGPLSYLAARTPCTTLDLHTNYIRSINAGDTLVVTARVVSRGLSAMHLSAEAVNGKRKLIATCTSHMVPIKS
ncbi:MAG: PaaI family thioesterase [Ignavibacteriales bacterium]|nr:PaaI family thioesterase [Ignavibacteriales bacterium]